jgi:hypothetical protein
VGEVSVNLRAVKFESVVTMPLLGGADIRVATEGRTKERKGRWNFHKEVARWRRKSLPHVWIFLNSSPGTASKFCEFLHS